MTRDIAHEIDSLFNKAKQMHSPNGFNADNFRKDVVEYLDDIDGEIAEDPELADQSHFDLVMDDGDLDYDAFFATMIIHPNALEIIAGIGNSYEVRATVESHSMIEVDQVRSALTAKFHCHSTKIPRADAEQWLGRSLGLNSAS